MLVRLSSQYAENQDAMMNGRLAKASLTKANQAKAKLENIARELQKAGKYSIPRNKLYID